MSAKVLIVFPDLDAFCLTVQRELHEITAVSFLSSPRRPVPSSHLRPTLQHSCPEPDEYIITAWNQPFAPGDRRTAEEMVTDVDHLYHTDEGMHSIRRTLLKSWWDVDQITRSTK